MFHLVRRASMPVNFGRSLELEGAPYSAGVSIILVDNDPGEGPALHRHPYPETWIVRAGRARFTVEGKTVDADSGDVIVVSPGAAHMFRNIGSERLELVCIHASDRFVTEWLDQR